MSDNNITIKYKDTVHLEESEMNNVASTLSEYLGFLLKTAEKDGYDVPESFLHLPFDTELLVKNDEIAATLASNSLKYVIVAGIGGSNLGAFAVYDAIFPKFDALDSRRPKLLFSDTNNSREMEVLKKIIDENVHDPKDIVLNIITKSGTTVETIANSMFLFNEISSKFGEEAAISRTVITTDEGSALWNIARDKNIHLLPIPKNVGGRYSVFSPAGIFPLRLVGINTALFVKGAADMISGSRETEPSKNPALLSAAIDFLVHKKKLNIYNNFFFHPEMESVGKWGRQLMAESLGKKYDKEGNTLYAGMTPIVSIGSTDLHSMVQLYLGGPRDKFTNFIYAEGAEAGRITVPTFSPFGALVPDIIGKDFQKIVSSILHGTIEAYKEMAFPYIETVFPEINEYYLGQYFMLRMLETVLLGKLWNINAFDQPEVESYKKVARELLKKQ
jgi:glucose-6-phosphate isomerase